MKRGAEGTIASPFRNETGRTIDPSTPLLEGYLPQNGVEDQGDHADADGTPGIATGGGEDAKVDRKRLRILLRTGGIAPKPYAIATNEHSKEDECLEADVVQIGGEFGGIAHAYNDDGNNDHHET